MDCANLVKKASTPPKDGSPIEVVSIACLKPIKLLCREQQGAAKELFYYLSLDLSKRNGVIRLRVLFVMDYLLHRSKEFRLLVFSDLRQISKCMGLLSDQNSASDRSVPIVTSHAQELLTKGKELIEIWDHLYGDRYPQLRAIARYFRESLRLQMPNILENAAFHAERTERNKQHSLNLLLLQRNKLLEAEWPSCMNEWKTSVGRLEECFNILFPRFSDTPVEDASKTRDPVPPPTASASAATAADQDDVDWVNEEELDESSAHTNALVGRTTEAAVAAEAAEFGDRTASAGAPYTLTIRLATAAADIETGDNAVLLQHIRELSRQLARSAVPKLLHWQDLFSQVAAVYAERVEVLHGPAAPSAFDSAHLQAHVVGDVAGAALLHQSHTSPSPSSLAACGAASTASVSCGSASLLGKRRADTAVSFAHPDMMETGTASATASTSALLELEKLQAEQRSVHLQLLDMAALLGEIHTLLTGKCKTLLQDEAI